MKVRLDLRSKSITDKLELGKLVIGRVTANPNYPNAAGRVVRLQTAQAKLQAEYAELQVLRHIAKAKTSAVNACESDWDTQMTQLGLHVESEAGGAPQGIVGVGLQLRSPRSPIGTLLAPEFITARHGNLPGVIKLRWGKIRGAANYVVERSLVMDQADAWERVGIPTSTSFMDTKLQRGTLYYYRVAGNGTAGIGVWSQIVGLMAV